MVAALNQPIVTDYVPAWKPWALLALTFGLLLAIPSRHSLPDLLYTLGIG